MRRAGELACLQAHELYPVGENALLFLVFFQRFLPLHILVVTCI